MNYVIYALLVTNSTEVPIVIQCGSEKRTLYPGHSMTFTNMCHYPSTLPRGW